tara:strand:+ start:2039 stop:2215 length:177 start_codon:yes stop_codon:yes gene_type:complete
MYIRNYKGELIKININQFNNDKEKYNYIWNIMYNINLKENDKYNANLMKYIIGNNIFE